MKKQTALIALMALYSFSYAEIKTPAALQRYWENLRQKSVETWQEQEAQTAHQAFEELKTRATIRAIKPEFDRLYSSWLALQEQRTRVAELTNRATNLRKELATRAQEYGAQIGDLENKLTAELDKAKTRTGFEKSRAELQAKFLQNDIDRLTKAKKEEETKVATLEQKVQEVQAEKAGAETRLQSALDQKEIELAETKARAELAERKQQEMANTIEQLIAKQTELETEIKKSSSTIAELEKARKKAIAEKDELAKLKTETQINLEKIMQEQQEQHALDIAKIKAEKDAAITDLERGTITTKELEEKIKQHERKLEKKDQETITLQQQLKTTQKTLEESIAKKSLWESSKARLNTEIKDLKETIEILQKREDMLLEEQVAQVHELNKELTEREEELAISKQQEKALKEQIQNLQTTSQENLERITKELKQQAEESRSQLIKQYEKSIESIKTGAAKQALEQENRITQLQKIAKEDAAKKTEAENIIQEITREKEELAKQYNELKTAKSSMQSLLKDPDILAATEVMRLQTKISELEKQIAELTPKAQEPSQQEVDLLTRWEERKERREAEEIELKEIAQEKPKNDEPVFPEYEHFDVHN